MTRLVIVSNPYSIATDPKSVPYWQVRKNGAVGVILIEVGSEPEAKAFVQGWFDAAVEDITNRVGAMEEREHNRRFY